jgi:hypothetical protein
VSALDAAVAVAREHGLRVDEPRVLKDSHNLVVHLAPSPVVARVGQAMSQLRPGIRGRELAVTRWLVDRGAPVLPPFHDEVLERDGHELTLWPYVEPREPDGDEAARALIDVRTALANCPVLGGFWPLTEMRELIARLGLRAEVEAARAYVEAKLRYDPVGLHGDAHLRNCLFTEDGPRWSDLEDSCYGPSEWDAACLAAHIRRNPGDVEHRAALERLGTGDERRFELLEVLRGVVIVTWSAFAYGITDENEIDWLRRKVSYAREM